MQIPARVHFKHTLQQWDGFGINYVETAQTPDYADWPQDYGGFSTLNEAKRQEILQLIFGEDGLKPGVFKMFIDGFQQDAGHINGPELGDIDQGNYDHLTTTKWMRYFIREGLRITRARGADLRGIATLYGPPAFMTKIRKVRGRDLDPSYETECAKYMVSFGKYMRDVEKIPVEYLSIHNEGEDFSRWPEDGQDPNLGTGHDYNMYWSPEHVAAFLPLLKRVADASGSGLQATPGECTGWSRFAHWGYADAIAENSEAMDALGLITSHGFYGDGLNKQWSNTHSDTGIARLRALKPALHAWVTSTSWKNMDSAFAFELHRAVYDSKVNSIIPWAAVQLVGGWVGGDPNPGCAFSVKGDGSYRVEKGYYYYRQISRIGQPGMRVAAASCAYTPCAILAFAGADTGNADAFAVINTDSKTQTLEVEIAGGAARYSVTRTSPTEQSVDLGTVTPDAGHLTIECPADSVTTFVQTNA